MQLRDMAHEVEQDEIKLNRVTRIYDLEITCFNVTDAVSEEEIVSRALELPLPEELKDEIGEAHAIGVMKVERNEASAVVTFRLRRCDYC